MTLNLVYPKTNGKPVPHTSANWRGGYIEYAKTPVAIAAEAGNIDAQAFQGMLATLRCAKPANA